MPLLLLLIVTILSAVGQDCSDLIPIGKQLSDDATSASYEHKSIYSGILYVHILVICHCYSLYGQSWVLPNIPP